MAYDEPSVKVANTLHKALLTFYNANEDFRTLTSLNIEGTSRSVFVAKERVLDAIRCFEQGTKSSVGRQVIALVFARYTPVNGALERLVDEEEDEEEEPLQVVPQTKYDFVVDKSDIQYKTLPCFGDDDEDMVTMDVPCVKVLLDGKETLLYDGISCYQVIYGQPSRDNARSRFNDLGCEYVSVKIEQQVGKPPRFITLTTFIDVVWNAQSQKAKNFRRDSLKTVLLVMGGKKEQVNNLMDKFDHARESGEKGNVLEQVAHEAGRISDTTPPVPEVSMESTVRMEELKLKLARIRAETATITEVIRSQARESIAKSLAYVQEVTENVLPRIQDKGQKDIWERMLMCGSTTDDKVSSAGGNVQDNPLDQWQSIQSIISGLKSAKYFKAPIDSVFGSIVAYEYEQRHGIKKDKSEKYKAITNHLVQRKINGYHVEDHDWIKTYWKVYVALKAPSMHDWKDKVKKVRLANGCLSFPDEKDLDLDLYDKSGMENYLKSKGKNTLKTINNFFAPK